MNINPTIYAYLGEGFILCPSCAEQRQTPYDDAGLQPLGAYSGLRFDCGEVCDDCLEWAVEPSHEDGEECEECGFGL